jgi:valyl-tRNA synthetase
VHGVVEKEGQKSEKARKFLEKQAKLKSAAANAGTAKEKKREKNNEVLPEYREETPNGQKKRR